MTPLRIVIADDERPARSFLAALLRSFPDVEVIGEAATGPDAVDLIERTNPDLALLDLQMPELDGIGVVRLLRRMPLVAFVTAYDEYAVRAFELNAIDYLLKPVERTRLRETIDRARERLDRADAREQTAANLKAVVEGYDAERTGFLERIPVRHKEEIVLLPVDRIASVVADGELLHFTTDQGRRYTINHRLKDIEARLDPTGFVRLSRGTLVNIMTIDRISPLPGGTYLVTLVNKQTHTVSRIQSRIFRETVLRI